MSGPTAETLAHSARRRAILEVVHAHPEWSIAVLAEQIDRRDERSEALASITIAELLELSRTHNPEIDRARLRRAKQLVGAAFDAIVLEVLTEAGGLVGSTHVRDRVGGPRWKLQASFRRLMDAGKIERQGVTSGARYRLVAPAEPPV